MNNISHFDKFVSEHNEFIRGLSQELNRPVEDEKKVIHVLKAVLHTLRERLTMQQSFHVLTQLPAILKLYYIEGWKFREKPVKFDSIEAFSEAVKQEQYRLGEREFDWEKSTAEIVNIVLASLKKYLAEGTIQNIFAELPPTLHPLFI